MRYTCTMTILEAVLLGIVEGITEFLPISSTGHLILTSSLLGLEHTEFLKSFEIAIQLGAIVSVVLLYWRSFLDIPLLGRIATAFVPTALVGAFLYPFIKGTLLGNELIVVAALAIGGVALIIFELSRAHGTTESLTHISYGHAFLIGIAQSVAVIPGVSRSASTIVGGLLIGIDRVKIVEFSFLLAVPTMAAATILDLSQSAFLFTGREFTLLAVGFVVSCLVALAAITWLLRFVRTHTFIGFGIYRIFIAAVFYFFFLS